MNSTFDHENAQARFNRNYEDDPCDRENELQGQGSLPSYSGHRSASPGLDSPPVSMRLMNIDQASPSPSLPERFRDSGELTHSSVALSILRRPDGEPSAQHIVLPGPPLAGPSPSSPPTPPNPNRSATVRLFTDSPVHPASAASDGPERIAPLPTTAGLKVGQIGINAENDDQVPGAYRVRGMEYSSQASSEVSSIAYSNAPILSVQSTYSTDDDSLKDGSRMESIERKASVATYEITGAVCGPKQSALPNGLEAIEEQRPSNDASVEKDQTEKESKSPKRRFALIVLIVSIALLATVGAVVGAVLGTQEKSKASMMITFPPSQEPTPSPSIFIPPPYPVPMDPSVPMPVFLGGLTCNEAFDLSLPLMVNQQILLFGNTRVEVSGNSTSSDLEVCGEIRENGLIGIWYKVQFPMEMRSSRWLFSTCAATEFDTQLSVFSGLQNTTTTSRSCDSLQCVAGNTRFETVCPGGGSQLAFFAQAEVPYLIYLHGLQNQSGFFELAVSRLADHDTCSSALVLTNNGLPVFGTTRGLGLGRNESQSGSNFDHPECGSATIDSSGVWYSLAGDSFTQGLTVILRIRETSFPAELALYRGSCGAMDCVAGGSDGGNGTAVSFVWEDDVEYHVFVHGGEEGDFSLTLTSGGQ